MKVDFKKLTASAISVAMLASLSGCAMFDKDDEAVLKVAEDYATAVTKVKAGDIVELLADPDDDLQESIEQFVETDGYGDDYAAICNAIAGTLSYEIDEESVESSKKKGEASVAITFSVADYQAAYEDVTADGGDLDAFISAIEDADKTEIEQTIEFVLEDDGWLVDDSSAENVHDIYEFYIDAFDFTFTAPLIDYVESTEWYYSDNGVYSNYSQIELDIITTTEGNEVPFEFTYEYYLDGALVFTSDVCTDQGHYIEAYYGPSYDSAAQVTDEGYLVDGQYRCVIYDLSGNVLADDTCTVETTSGAVVIPTGSDDMADIWANGINDYWYTYADGNGSAMGEGEYSTSESVIEYTCEVLDSANLAFYPVYYEVYYSASGSMSDAECVYTGTITPSQYTNGYFYEFQYVDNAGLDAGTYWLIGASDEAGTTMFFNVEATVS